MIQIPIERLSSGELIYCPAREFGPFGQFAEVQNVHDEGEDERTYTVTVLLDGTHEHIEFLTIPYGGFVQFGGEGEPRFSRVAERAELEAAA